MDSIEFIESYIAEAQAIINTYGDDANERKNRLTELREEYSDKITSKEFEAIKKAFANNTNALQVEDTDRFIEIIMGELDYNKEEQPKEEPEEELTKQEQKLITKMDKLLEGMQESIDAGKKLKPSTIRDLQLLKATLEKRRELAIEDKDYRTEILGLNKKYEDLKNKYLGDLSNIADELQKLEVEGLRFDPQSNKFFIRGDTEGKTDEEVIEFMRDRKNNEGNPVFDEKTINKVMQAINNRDRINELRNEDADKNNQLRNIKRDKRTEKRDLKKQHKSSRRGFLSKVFFVLRHPIQSLKNPDILLLKEGDYAEATKDAKEKNASYRASLKERVTSAVVDAGQEYLNRELEGVGEKDQEMDGTGR